MFESCPKWLVNYYVFFKEINRLSNRLRRRKSFEVNITPLNVSIKLCTDRAISRKGITIYSPYHTFSHKNSD